MRRPTPPPLSPFRPGTIHPWRRAVAALALLAALAPLALAATAGAGGRDDPDAIVGLWRTAPTENGFARVEIVRRDDAYFGTLVWLDEETYPADDPMAGRVKVDRENPDPALRDRTILGLEIVRGLEWAGDGRWQGGTIYDPESGKTYKSKAELADGGAALDLRGYIGISLLGRTSRWTRVEPVEQP
jgi:uncharacterized protein (DUF2147 family)